MTEVYRFNEPQMLLFFLVLIRISTFVVTWPVFGVETVSQHIKILFAFVIAIMVFPTLHFSGTQYSMVKESLIHMAVREAVIGALMGMLGRIFFFVFQIAGELASLAMGLSSAQIFNPTLGGQSTAIEQFHVAFATLFYLAVNGHHLLLAGLVDSFRLVPLTSELLHTSEFKNMSLIISEIVSIGLRLSAPVMISILVVNVVLGIVGKTVPQMNVLVTSFPINILIGFTILILTLPLMMDQVGDLLELTTTEMFRLVKTF